jgi:DNA-binding HxlR family transcriptional regulator
VNYPAATQTNGKSTCPISGFQKFASGKHKLRILWALRDATLAYGELKREASYLSEFAVAPRVLTRELRALENYGLVARTPVPGKVRRVEYRLTDLGRSFVPLLENICTWTVLHLNVRAAAQDG